MTCSVYHSVVSFQSDFAACLLLKSIAPLWAGAITPKLGGHQIPGVVDVPDYDEESREGGWGTECGPNDECSQGLHPFCSNAGTVNLLPWKCKFLLPASVANHAMCHMLTKSRAISAGALQTTVATASRKNGDTKTSRCPRLDNTGYWYSTRSYGVGASAGLEPGTIHRRRPRGDQDLQLQREGLLGQRRVQAQPQPHRRGGGASRASPAAHGPSPTPKPRCTSAGPGPTCPTGNGKGARSGARTRT